jgi:signal transduction histidine kinase
MEVVAEVVEPVIVFADRLRFKQVLHTLLSNALKFTPDGGKSGSKRRLAMALRKSRSRTQESVFLKTSTNRFLISFIKFRRLPKAARKALGSGWLSPSD